MNFYDFTVYKKSKRSYGGNAGLKLGVIIDNENWFIKFPKSTVGMRNAEISYTTSPLSEYLGSQIYKSIGFEVHETRLGSFGDKVVVACKDFREPTEELVEFRAIKNDYIAGLEEAVTSSSDGGNTQLSTLEYIMNENSTFREMPELKSRFWNMFVVDALIGNNNRNNGNWGILVNHISENKRIAPVYDNGAAFSSKLSDGQIDKIMADEARFIQSVYQGRTCVFVDDNGNQINPLRYIETTDNKDCVNAVKRVVCRIDISKLESIIDDTPETVGALSVITKTQKEFYKKCLRYRYEKVLLPTLKKIKTQEVPLLDPSF